MAESQMSRGALYHQFANKAALFLAVLEAVEEDITVETARAAGSTADPVEALRAFDSSPGMAGEAEVRQIVLTDAHSVLGWQKWREIEGRYGLGRLKMALKMIAATGGFAKTWWTSTRTSCWPV